MQRYNQRMMEQLRLRQQQERARLPKVQRSEGKTRMAMYKKSLHISSSSSAAEQREKIKQVGSIGLGLPVVDIFKGPFKKCVHVSISNLFMIIKVVFSLEKKNVILRWL